MKRGGESDVGDRDGLEEMDLIKTPYLDVQNSQQ